MDNTLVLANTVDFMPIVQPILEVLDAILWPAIAIVVAVGTIYCIFLGVKIAKSDEQNSREKAKKDLIGAIIGFLLIFVLIVGLKIAVPILEEWVKTQL
jgi:Na+-translocating ferredoxin:NAD+ oxidoreductase RnfA subunit